MVIVVHRGDGAARAPPDVRLVHFAGPARDGQGKAPRVGVAAQRLAPGLQRRVVLERDVLCIVRAEPQVLGQRVPRQGR